MGKRWRCYGFGSGLLMIWQGRGKRRWCFGKALAPHPSKRKSQKDAMPKNIMRPYAKHPFSNKGVIFKN